MSQRQRDEDFYMTLVTIQVEDCLFKVPPRVLESQSEAFQAMFSLSAPTHGDGMGASDENPIRISGVKAEEFRLLLKVLLVDILGPQISLPSTSDEWISVIQLAGTWGLEDVRKKAIQMVPYSSVQKSSAEKVALAFKLDIKEWLLPGLLELAKRPEPIGMEDVELLGWKVALEVAAVRESLVLGTGLNQPFSYNFGQVVRVGRVASGVRDAENVDFTHTIRKIFQLPLPGVDECRKL